MRKNACALIQSIAGGAALTGFAVMIGWHLQNADFVRAQAGYSSMKFDAALSMFCTGMALFFADRGQRNLGTLFGLAGLVLPLATLLEYASGFDFGIDEIFAKSFVETSALYQGRMAPNTMIAFLIIDAAVILYARIDPLTSACKLALALAGSIVMALGLAPVMGYLGGIESAHSWGNFTGMALPTALCFSLIGLAMIVCTWRKSSNLPAWLPVPVAIGFLTITFSLWMAVTSYEDLRFEQNLQLESDYIAGRTNDRLTSFYAAIDRIGSRWVMAGGTPRALWENDMEGYLKAYSFLKTLEWVDKDSVLQWAVPEESVRGLIGTRLNEDGARAAAAHRAMETHDAQVSEPVQLLQGGTGFLYMNPLYSGDKFDGFIVAAYTLDDIFARILQREKSGPFYITVSEKGAVLFTNAPAGYVPPERWHINSVVTNKGRSWEISVAAAPELLAHKNSPLAGLVLVTGLLTALFATFSVLLAIRSRRDTEAVRKAETKLLSIIDAHSILSSASFDLNALMDRIVEDTQEMTPATGAVIELIEEDEMVYHAASGSIAPYTGMHIERAGSLSGLCVETQEVMISRDTASDPRVAGEACRKVGAASMVAAPLIQRGKVVGVLKAVSLHVDAFKEQDIGTLQLMAGLLGGALGQQLEIEHRRRMEEKLLHMAQNDAMTGLPNRTLFHSRLQHALVNHARSGGILAVMYMDIDHFKSINDSYGHAEGDALLKQFAARVAAVLRRGDTLARLGGDEFTVIAENMKNPADAEIIAGKILEAVRAPFHLQNTVLTIGVSIGIAVSVTSDIAADDFVKRADQMLYEAKREGRNRFKLTVIAA